MTCATGDGALTAPWARTGDRRTWAAATRHSLLAASPAADPPRWTWHVTALGSRPDDAPAARGESRTRLAAQLAAERAARSAR
jgi:hypothetical protein